MSDRILTAQELAADLRVPLRRVYELAASEREPRLPVLRLGERSLRFRWSDVQRWMDALAGRAQA